MSEKPITEIPTPMTNEEAGWYREGENANDNNRRVYRQGKGNVQGNPYDVGSVSWKAWSAGYSYRDMVNDG